MRVELEGEGRGGAAEWDVGVLVCDVQELLLHKKRHQELRGWELGCRTKVAIAAP